MASGPSIIRRFHARIPSRMKRMCEDTLGAVDFFNVAQAWNETWPGAVAGILAMRDVANPERHADLEREIEARESAVRARVGAKDRAALRALPVLAAYSAYYARYRKTYHVQLQLESVALKGKPLPRGPGLVAAMIASEIQSLLLTAGHDLDAVRLPITLSVATGDERYTLLRGEEQQPKRGDMMMADAAGVISTVLHGPDARTRMTAETRHVLFAVYAPPGVAEQSVAEHLEALRDSVRFISPAASVTRLATFVAT
jgi:DNA/RNA-binding domain of Phe-tRNA-synthetase-like protein